MVSWGTNPGMVAPVTGRVPDPASFEDDGDRESAERALQYMDLEPDTPIEAIDVDRVFLGVVHQRQDRRPEGRRGGGPGSQRHDGVYAMVVPGSNAVKRQAEAEGLDAVFKDAGFDWRRLAARCASA